MDLMTISDISRGFNVSTRSLRYYEQIGLLTSQKMEDYAYRVYDENSVRRLQHIIFLRKLRIPLKQIGILLNITEKSRIVEILQANIFALDNDITALTTIRNVLYRFISHINNHDGANITLNLLDDREIIKVVESLSLTKIEFKEKCSMDDLNKANEILEAHKNVRIIYLPPTTIASSHFIGANPESGASKQLDDFVRSVDLQKVKPDLRVYGFNNPCPQDDSDIYGYEFWVTIPDDMELHGPILKKHFEGGLYAAYCISMGDFHEWQTFYEWICNNDTYEFDKREPSGMNGTMEEHLNAFTYYQTNREQAKFNQIDLLIPIKMKNSNEK